MRRLVEEERKSSIASDVHISMVLRRIQDVWNGLSREFQTKFAVSCDLKDQEFY